ncbi:MAG TPA: hypothetical protein VFV99_05635 [Kofleriaceae bacterium]|nr:hypothetical protein [Kofleriaceae bacterium]
MRSTRSATLRHILTAGLVLFATRGAVAQPAPTDPPPATPPADQEQPPATPTAPAAEPPVPVEETPLKPEPEKKTEEKRAVTIKYDNGMKFSTADDQFELKLQFRNQVRFEANRPLDDETPTRHNQWFNRFYIPRARLQAEGHLFGNDNRFKAELGMGDSGSFAFLRDMYLEKRLPDSPIYLRFGQWKRPYNRMEIVSDFSSTFNERSIENEQAGGGRDLGIALHNDYEKSPAPIEWAVGMFNTLNGGQDRPTWTTACVQDPVTLKIACTNTRPTTFPLDFEPALVARVGYNTPNIKGYSESDLEGGPLRYAVAASYKVGLGNLNKGAQDSWADNLSHGFEIDTMIKAWGFGLEAGVELQKLKTADANVGFYVQPSYFLTPKTIEVAGRFALITVKEIADDRKEIETRVAFNYYWHGHIWKIASDGGFIQFLGDTPAPDQPDLQFRVMMQMQI